MNTIELPLKTRRVLVVEDNEPLCGLLQDILTVEGFEVHRAGDGKLGLAEAKRTKPTVIITDIEMPNMNGFELLEKLGADADLKDITVIIVSMYGGEELDKMGRQLGAAAIFHKPFNCGKLVEAVKACF